MSKEEVQKIYKEIQNMLFNLIPEKWESIYLYASVVKNRGEMYFYYFPKKTILKTKPVNCYEIASKFGLDESQYNILLSKLYEKIKQLNNISIKKWTNLTISIVQCLFTVEYHFNDLIRSLYTDEQRHIYWEYKYLHKPIESMSKQNQILVKYYEEKGEKPLIYTEGIYVNKNDSAINSKLIEKPWEKFVKREVYETKAEENEVSKVNKKVNLINDSKLRNEYLDESANKNIKVKNPILKY